MLFVTGFDDTFNRLGGKQQGIMSDIKPLDLHAIIGFAGKFVFFNFE